MGTKGFWYCAANNVSGWKVSPGPSGTVLTSNGEDEYPTYQTASSLPEGIIVMWSGLILNIPSGWLLCDGTNGTPDLRGMFLKGGTPGDTGGSTLHTPTGTVTAPVFTGSSATSAAVSAGTPAGTVSAPVFTGTSSQVTSAMSAGTPSGTNSAPTFTGSSATSSAVSAGTPAGSNSAPTFTGSPLSTHTHAYTDVVNHTHTTSFADVASATTGAATTHYQILTKTTDTSSTASDFLPATGNPSGGVATGTTAATSGGTPAGTVSAPTFTGSSLSTHTHTLTATGTNSAPLFTGDALGTHSHTLTTAGTVSAPSFTGNALGTHTHTLTATGTNSQPTFTGDAANYEPAWYALAFLMKAA